MNWQRISNPSLYHGQVIEVFHKGHMFFAKKTPGETGDIYEVTERLINLAYGQRQEAVSQLTPKQFQTWLEGRFWRYLIEPID